MSVIRIVRGLDLPIDGEPEQRVDETKPVIASVALLGGDYIGLRATMRVEEGDRVKTGQPLFIDRRDDEVLFTSPGNGRVEAINRGARRALVSVTVRLDGDEAEAFPSWREDQLAGLRRDQVVDALLASGLWTALRARPFGKVADPRASPSSLFVTAMDSNPLAARAEVVLEEFASDFIHGLAVISHLTEDSIFLCHAPYATLPEPMPDRVEIAEFSGPHPAGLPGTHIHFLDPVGANKTVWHVGYQDVIAIGKLFTTGALWTERIIALGGSAARRPRLLRTRLGASTDELVKDELHESDCRVISGSVLSGRQATGAEAYLGRYHNQISAIPEARQSGDGAQGPAPGDRFTTYGPRRYNRPVARKFSLSTALHGRPSAIIPLDQFERVMPLDVLPIPLLRALAVGDTELATDLGCLELEEEDLALCGFVCPGKQDYGALLRAALRRIEKDG
jgi:Na+-transporting NADH:ubiquinone oxidoreductase subunit A